MADKLEEFKGLVGEDLYAKILNAVGEKEGTAAVVGMVAKEAKDSVVDKTDKETEQTEAPVVDEKLTAAFEAVVKAATEPLAAKITELEHIMGQRAKESGDAVEKRFKELEAGIQEAKSGVAELKGETTKAVKNRASQSETTVSATVKAGPAADPQNDFMAFLLGNEQ